MKNLKKLSKKAWSAKVFAMIIVCFTLSATLRAQDTAKAKRPSPPAMVLGKISDANIAINYSSPSVKGRKIFGGKLPYDTVWRAGANEATIFQTDKDILVEGKKLPAGKYSFFATPGKKKWTIFFNSETGQWGDKPGGATNMNPTKTVISFDVKVKTLNDLRERLEYYITNDGFGLRWEYSDVFIRVK
jgi:hypothetical protein